VEASKEAVANMVLTSGSFDGQKQVGTDDGFIGSESLEPWISMLMLSKPDGPQLAYSQYPATWTNL
jgi:hypothetical protein